MSCVNCGGIANDEYNGTWLCFSCIDDEMADEVIDEFRDKIITGDCLIEMLKIPDKSIDMILCDLPYGTTACKWDTIIPFEPLWKEYKRIIKDNGAIVLTASQPFTSALVMSNIKAFKYSWIWNKGLAGNAILAKKQPLKIHEDILVFNYGKNKYYPQMVKGKMRGNETFVNKMGTWSTKSFTTEMTDMRYPKSILDFSNAGLRSDKVHLTQKPVELFACKMLGRNFILIEKELEYVKICEDRIKSISNPLF